MQNHLGFQLPHRLQVPTWINTVIPELTSWLEKADILPKYCHLAARKWLKGLVVIFDDTDSVLLLLHWKAVFKESGLLLELKAEYGIQDKKGFIPLHIPFDKLSNGLCLVLIKHVIL